MTGGAGTLGSAIVRRLLADPAYDVRVADRKDAPQWMREACEIRTGDLRGAGAAAAAVEGCAHVVHLAGTPAEGRQGDYETIAGGVALDDALLRAAIHLGVERFVYLSCAEPADGSPSDSAHRLAKLVGERLCQAARTERGLSVAICRVASSDAGEDHDRGGPDDVDEQILTDVFAALSGECGDSR